MAMDEIRGVNDLEVVRSLRLNERSSAHYLELTADEFVMGQTDVPALPQLDAVRSKS